MQLSMKTVLTAEKKDISVTSEKIEENLKELKKIESRMN